MPAGSSCFCDAETPRDEKAGDFRWVGNSKGKYEQVDSYDFVGEGRGAWQKRVDVEGYGWKPRWTAWIACVAVLIVLCILLRGCFPGGDGVDRSYASGDELYDCKIAAPAKGMLVLEAAWQSIDTDGDRRFSFEALQALSADGKLSSTALKYVSGADVNGDGALSGSEFLAALGRAGLAALPTTNSAEKRSQTRIFAEASWLVADQDGDGRATLAELKSISPPADHPESAGLFAQLEEAAGDSGLTREQFVNIVDGAMEVPLDAPPPPSWTSQQRLFCCATHGIGCVAAPKSSSS
mmetsp:Transcript_71838/g.208147  ORF Transcript_71838/g.208147 Transcript_71838/m.208147 type:complete len:295 (-) Transcript_71838:74-958(-)